MHVQRSIFFFSLVNFNPTHDMKPSRHGSHTNMASGGSGEVKTPELLKADIWNYFGFRNVETTKFDISKAICKICQMEVKFCGNMTNFRNHMQQHHQENLN